MLSVGLLPPTPYHNVSAVRPLLPTPPPVAVFNSVPRLVQLTYQPPVGRPRYHTTAGPRAEVMTAADVTDSFMVDDYVTDDEDEGYGRRRSAHGRRSTRKRGRRTVNLYPSDKPKEARLYSRSSRGFLRVDPETLMVSTDRHGNSVYEVIEVMFLCQAAAALLGRCPPMFGRQPYDAGSNGTSTTDSRAWPTAAISGGRISAAIPTGGSLALLRFSSVDRYLCIDRRAQVVLKQRLDSIEECAFQHDTIGGQYDVYYSWKYPSSPHSSNAPCDPGSDANGCRRHDQRHRRRRWYLGVAKNGTLRTFISGSGHDAAIAVSAPRHRTMFVQRWISRLGNAPAQLGPLMTLTTSTDRLGQSGGADGDSSSSKSPSGRRCSRLLRHCRRQRPHLSHRNAPREQPQRPHSQKQQQQQQQHRPMPSGNDDGGLRHRHRQQLGLSSAKSRLESSRSETWPPDT